MRLSEFWQQMEKRFGPAYARSIAADHRLSLLGASVDEALARGESPKAVWRAICSDFEVPAALR